MAFSNPKQTAKASTSKSLTNISISLEQTRNASKRNRSVDDLEFHKETVWDPICRGSGGIASSSSSSIEIGSTRSDPYPTGHINYSQTSDTETSQTSDETISETVANPIDDHRSSTNVDRPKTVSLLYVSESGSSCSSIAIQSSNSAFDRNRTSERYNQNITKFETVRRTRPPTPYNYEEHKGSDEDSFENTLRSIDSNVFVIPGLRIFERDVEVDAHSTSRNFSDSRDYIIRSYESSSEEVIEEGSYNSEDSHTMDMSKLPRGFPKEIIAALGHDSDAIMQAAIQWRRQFEGLFPRPISSSSESNENICRICHSGDSRECLIYPCKCDGTVRWTHQSCLITWIAQCGAMTCELCGARYKVRLVGPRNCFRWKSIELSINDKLHMLLFLFASAFLLVTFSFVIWFSISHQDRAARESQSQIIFPIYSCLDAVALAIVCFEGKYTFLKLLRRWRAKNMGIIILNRKESDEKVIEMSMVPEAVEEQAETLNEVDMEIQTTV